MKTNGIMVAGGVLAALYLLSRRQGNTLAASPFGAIPAAAPGAGAGAPPRGYLTAPVPTSGLITGNVNPLPPAAPTTQISPGYTGQPEPEMFALPWFGTVVPEVTIPSYIAPPPTMTQADIFALPFLQPVTNPELVAPSAAPIISQVADNGQYYSPLQLEILVTKEAPLPDYDTQVNDPAYNLSSPDTNDSWDPGWG